jgi:prolyl-tRNA synthetase
MVTDIFRSYVKSYKDLPLNLYHIQWKFRDERRPRFGVMRGREFLMKDAYSFDLDYEASKAAYNRMFVSYLRTFERCGLKSIPMRADTGPIGGNLSHEFIVLAETGESQVFCHRDFEAFEVPSADTISTMMPPWQPLSRNGPRLLLRPTRSCTKTGRARPGTGSARTKNVSARGIEVGHIFHFGTKYSEPMNAYVQGPDGKQHFVSMGSYGIGPSRLLGAIIEASHDDNGIIWPQGVAPFDIGLINMKPGDAACDAACEKLESALENAGLEVLYDDTDERAGAKFATADLIGLPIQVIAGPRAVADGNVEIKIRATGERETLSIEAAINRLAQAR